MARSMVLLMRAVSVVRWERRQSAVFKEWMEGKDMEMAGAVWLWKGGSLNGALASLPCVHTSICLVPDICRIVSSYNTRGTTGSWYLIASEGQVWRRECLPRSPWASWVMTIGARLELFTRSLYHTLPTPVLNVWLTRKNSQLEYLFKLVSMDQPPPVVLLKLKETDIPLIMGFTVKESTLERVWLATAASRLLLRGISTVPGH